MATRPLTVLDTRGEGLAVLVFADGASAAVCRATVDHGGAVAAVAREIAGASGAKAPGTGTLGIHDLEVVQQGASARSILVGQVGGGVHSVAANFDADAAWFTASMADGWYAIWWPGTGRPLGVASSDIRSVVIDSCAPQAGPARSRAISGPGPERTPPEAEWRSRTPRHRSLATVGSRPPAPAGRR